MTLYSFIYSEKALKDLNKLPRPTSDYITNKIDFFRHQENPFLFAKKLKGLFDLYRFRIGDYRAVFSVDDKGNIKILVILRIKHRKEIYRF
ncbi:MAG: hypothetical protein UT33_C0018G0011 [Candidatus Peregrinibacteria bacterium GW2011_GWC2_39_14]|nr:MAG: Plasmid stabilization system [Candidatus Peregrinibacteria bacterium GW2011_GWA2_38_36]KKR04659.1 MAG: hypothetical protein UT33_C0018G0011 [Candidatus Peregrinibacteria bacterium GW2011_GWC2_39_14]